MDWTVSLDIFGRIALAGALGILIGLERERDGHPAGTRTVATVAIGAALFGAISTAGFDEFFAERSTTNVQVDVTRVASQVVVGIGFLGAGMIFRQGGSVQNLTTAATLWAVAAMGLAAGVGQVGLAAAVAGLILVVLIVVPRPQQWVLRRWTNASRQLQIGLDAGGAATSVRAAIEARSEVEIRSWRVEKHDDRIVVVTRVHARTESVLDQLTATLVEVDEVVDLRSLG